MSPVWCVPPRVPSTACKGQFAQRGCLACSKGSVRLPWPERSTPFFFPSTVPVSESLPGAPAEPTHFVQTCPCRRNLAHPNPFGRGGLCCVGPYRPDATNAAAQAERARLGGAAFASGSDGRRMDHRADLLCLLNAGAKRNRKLTIDSSQHPAQTDARDVPACSNRTWTQMHTL